MILVGVMMKLVTSRDPILNQTAKEVVNGENVSDVIDFMFKILDGTRGIGLAANQVGVLKRIIVLTPNGLRQEIINPVIVKTFNPRKKSIEGCLSAPGYKVKILRYSKIIVEGFDRNWNPVRRKLKELNSFCVQHEIDHLNGVVIWGGD